MTSLKEQLTFNFTPPPPRYGRDDFITKGRNEGLLTRTDAWLASGELALAICGPQGAGKTHLAKILATSAVSQNQIAGHAYWLDGAQCGDAERFVAAPSVKPAMGDLIILDDAQNAAPKVLFWIYEAAKAGGARLVFSGQGEPVDWAQDLKDMQTRLQAMARLSTDDPDEILMQEVLVKLFKDKQIVIDPEVASYAAARLQRRFVAAQLFVRAADMLAAERGSPVTKPLAREVIEALFP